MSYRAFISYSHAADGKLAPALQTALHRFAKPWYRLRAMRVFRDKTNLSASPGLWSDIEKALDKSDYFLYLASPEAASSKWVMREIDYWKKHKNVERLLIVLTDGEIHWDQDGQDFDWTQTTALPSNLAATFPEEPHFVDCREEKTTEQLSLRHTKFRSSVIDIAVPLHGKERDELDSEDVRQHRKTLALAWLATVSLVVLTIAAFQMYYEADRAKRAAEIRRLAAESRAIVSEDPYSATPLALAAVGQSISEFNTPFSSALLALTDAIQKDREQVTIPTPFNAWSLAIDPAENIIATGDSEGIVRYWDLTTKSELQAFKAHTDAIEAIAISPDGRIIATASRDGMVRRWDRNGNEIGQPLRAHSEWVTSLAFHPAGKIIASSGHDAKIILSDMQGELVGKPFRGHEAYVNSLSFSPDGNLLVSASGGGSTTDNSIRLWNLDGQQVVSPINGHSGYVNSVVFSPNGKQVASGSEDSTVMLWDLEGKQIGARFRGHMSAITAVAFSPDGRAVASSADTSSWDRTIMLSSLDGRQIGYSFKGHADQITGIVFSPDGARLISTGLDKMIRLWDVQGLEVTTLHGQVGDIWSIDFVSDSTIISASDSADGSPGQLIVWDLEKETSKVISTSPNGFYATAVNHAGLVAAATQNDVMVFNKNGKNIGVTAVPEGDGSIMAIDFHPDGQQFVTSGTGSQIRIWSAQPTAPRRVVGAQREWSLGVKYDPRGQLIATVSGLLEDPKGALSVFNLADNKYEIHAKDKIPGLVTIDWSPDGRYIFAGGGDGNRQNGVWIWDMVTKVPRFLVGHGVPVASVAVHPNGSMIASAGADGLVRLSSLPSGTVIAELRGHTAPIKALSFSPRGDRLASAGLGGVIKVWRTQIDEWIGVACTRIMSRSDILNTNSESGQQALRTCCDIAWKNGAPYLCSE